MGTIDSNLKVVAIGGGAPDKSALPLLKVGAEMTGLERPMNALIIPTAKRTQHNHIATSLAANRAFRQLGAGTVRVLHGFEQIPPPAELKGKIGEADIVYVAGGDTETMMKIWREHQIDQMLTAAAMRGLVMTGISAGAIAPMSWGHSDSASYQVPQGQIWNYIRVDALGLLPCAITPHYNTTPTRPGLPDTPRAQLFGEMFACEQIDGITGYGIDNFAAIQVHGGEVSAIATKPDAHVHRLTVDNDSKITAKALATKIVSA